MERVSLQLGMIHSIALSKVALCGQHLQTCECTSQPTKHSVAIGRNWKNKWNGRETFNNFI